jgi:hypothetical protein
MGAGMTKRKPAELGADDKLLLSLFQLAAQKNVLADQKKVLDELQRARQQWQAERLDPYDELARIVAHKRRRRRPNWNTPK